MNKYNYSKNPAFRFWEIFGVIALNSFNFYILIFLVVMFAAFNAITLTGPYSDVIQFKILVYGVIAAIFGALVGWQFYRAQIKKFFGWNGLIASVIFLVVASLLFLVLFSFNGYLGENYENLQPQNENPNFYEQHTNYTWLEPFIISFFEMLIFSGTAGALFYGAIKHVPNEYRKTAIWCVVILLGLFGSFYHVLTQEWNFISLLITWVMFSIFGVLVWIDEFFITKGMNVAVYTVPIRLAAHWQIDMYQFGNYANFALTHGGQVILSAMGLS